MNQNTDFNTNPPVPFDMWSQTGLPMFQSQDPNDRYIPIYGVPTPDEEQNSPDLFQQNGHFVPNCVQQAPPGQPGFNNGGLDWSQQFGPSGDVNLWTPVTFTYGLPQEDDKTFLREQSRLKRNRIVDFLKPSRPPVSKSASNHDAPSAMLDGVPMMAVQRYRQRKKAHIECLKKRVLELEDKIKALTEELNLSKIVNRIIKE